MADPTTSGGDTSSADDSAGLSLVDRIKKMITPNPEQAPTGSGGAAHLKTITDTVDKAAGGGDDSSTASNAGASAQSSDNFNKY